jgi:hypothetical protein
MTEAEKEPISPDVPRPPGVPEVDLEGRTQGLE